VEALKKMADEQLSVIEDLKKRNSSLESTNADQLKRLRRSMLIMQQPKTKLSRRAAA